MASFDSIFNTLKDVGPSFFIANMQIIVVSLLFIGILFGLSVYLIQKLEIGYIKKNQLKPELEQN